MNVLDFLQEDEDYNDTISGILYYCMECGHANSSYLLHFALIML